MGFIGGVNPTLEFRITTAFTVLAILLRFGLIPHHPSREHATFIIDAVDLTLLELAHRLANLSERPADERRDIPDCRAEPVYRQVAVGLALMHVADQFDPQPARGERAHAQPRIGAPVGRIPFDERLMRYAHAIHRLPLYGLAVRRLRLILVCV